MECLGYVDTGGRVVCLVACLGGWMCLTRIVSSLNPGVRYGSTFAGLLIHHSHIIDDVYRCLWYLIIYLTVEPILDWKGPIALVVS